MLAVVPVAIEAPPEGLPRSHRKRYITINDVRHPAPASLDATKGEAKQSDFEAPWRSLRQTFFWPVQPKLTCCIQKPHF